MSTQNVVWINSGTDNFPRVTPSPHLAKQTQRTSTYIVLNNPPTGCDAATTRTPFSFLNLIAPMEETQTGGGGVAPHRSTSPHVLLPIQHIFSRLPGSFFPGEVPCTSNVCRKKRAKRDGARACKVVAVSLTVEKTMQKKHHKTTLITTS